MQYEEINCNSQRVHREDVNSDENWRLKSPSNFQLQLRYLGLFARPLYFRRGLIK